MRAITIMTIITLSIAITACINEPTGQATTAQDTITIGLSAPLSGEFASFGASATAGLQLALEDYTDNNIMNGKHVRVIIEDDECSNKGAQTMNKLVNIDHADIILGPICSAAAGPGLPLTLKEETPTIIIATAPHLTKIGENIFRIYPSDNYQGTFSARTIKQALGKNKAAIIYVQNDWGTGLKDVFKKEYERLGGEIVHESGVGQEETDFRTIIEKVRSSEAEIIYMPTYEKNTIAAGRQMKTLGLNISVFGGDVYDAQEVIESGYAEGFLYPLAKAPDAQTLTERARALKGYEDLQPTFALAYTYDAAKIALQVTNNTQQKEEILTRLKTKTFSGITNPHISFDENGDVTDPTFNVMKIQRRRAIETSIKD